MFRCVVQGVARSVASTLRVAVLAVAPSAAGAKETVRAAVIVAHGTYEEQKKQQRQERIVVAEEHERTPHFFKNFALCFVHCCIVCTTPGRYAWVCPAF